MFKQSTGIQVFGGTFTTTVAGDFHDHHYGIKNAGLTLLKGVISDGAMFDSAQRYPAGTCHPGTRETVIKLIMDWIEDPSSDKDVLWLYGPAGAGKSSIMQKIAELLHRKKSPLYAGSFFFARDIPEREKSSALFLTLAYQIAFYIPGMDKLVNEAMISHPYVTTKTMEVQIQLLIIDPLKELLKKSTPEPIHYPIVIVDGLDECESAVQQRGILACIANAVTKHQIYLRFLIASRPEFWIDQSFGAVPLKDTTKTISLNDFEYESTRDIQTFLRDGFDRILDDNPDVMHGVAKPWPAANVIQHFTSMASCQFIYASTILKFIGDCTDDFLDPQTKLEMLLAPDEDERASAFHNLDRLYRRILLVYPRKNTLKMVLGGILVHADPTISQMFLGISKNETSMVLRAIGSLVTVTREAFELNGDAALDAIIGMPDPYIQYCHRSFPEFLENEKRSGEFLVKTESLSDHLASAAFSWLEKGILEASEPKSPVVYDTIWRDFLHIGLIEKLHPEKICHHLLHLSSVINDLVDGCGGILREGLHRIRSLRYALELTSHVPGSKESEHERMACQAAKALAKKIKSICEQSFLFHIQSLSDTVPTMRYLPCFTFTEVSLWEIEHVTTIDTSGVKKCIMDNAHFLTIQYKNPDFMHLDHDRQNNTSYPSYSFRTINLNDSIFGDKFAYCYERNSLQLCSAYFEHLNDLNGGKVRFYKSPGALYDTCIDVMENARAYEWEISPPFCDENFPIFEIRFVSSILGWLVRLFIEIAQSCENVPYGERILNLIGKIYEASFIPIMGTPNYAIPLFYNCTQHHMALIEIKYNRTEATIPASMIGIEHPTSYDDPDFDITLSGIDSDHYGSFIRLTNQITQLHTILDRGNLQYRAPNVIDRTALFTLFAETFFNILAKYLYGILDPRYTTNHYILETYGTDCVPLDIWLEHATPSNTILNALRVAMYAWKNISRKVEGANIQFEDAWHSDIYLRPITNFLQRYNLDENDSIFLAEWIQEMYKRKSKIFSEVKLLTRAAGRDELVNETKKTMHLCTVEGSKK